MGNCKIVISGYYGFKNAGDEAMLYSILRAVRSIDPAAEVTVISGKPEQTEAAFGVHAVPRFGGRAIFRKLCAADVLISGGGSLLQDVTSSRSCLYYLSLIWMAALLGKKVMLYAQGIGPIRRRWVARLARFVLSRADAITVRDETSEQFLKQIGVTAPIYTTADSVFFLTKEETETGKAILRAAGVPENKKIVGLSVRNWKDAETWTKAFATYIEKMAKEDVSLVFIPMQHPDDTRVAKSLCEKGFENVYFLDGTYRVEELMSIIGGLNLLVGMRLHALIFAALSHIPMIGISYDPKIDNFLSSVGEEALFPVERFDADKLYRASMEILGGNESAHPEKVEALQEKARTTVSILRTLMESAK